MQSTGNIQTNNPVIYNTNTSKQSNLFLYIIYIIFSIVFFSIGFYIFKDNKQYDTLVSAKIIDSNCDKIRGTNRSTTYTCTLKVEYFVDKLNTNKTQVITVKNALYYNGENIAIYYNSNNPSIIKPKSEKYTFFPYIFMGIGILIFTLFILTLLGILQPPVQVTSLNTPYYGYSYNYPYLTPEQTFASSVGLSLGSKLANKI